MATTLSSLTIGQPSQQLESVARLSLDFLIAQPTRARSHEDRRLSSYDARKEVEESTAVRPLSILPAIELHAASDFASSFGEYGWSLPGVHEQPAHRPLSIQSLARTIREGSSLSSSTPSGNDSKSRSPSDEPHGGGSDVKTGKRLFDSLYHGAHFMTLQVSFYRRILLFSRPLSSKSLGPLTLSDTLRQVHHRRR